MLWRFGRGGGRGGGKRSGVGRERLRRGREGKGCGGREEGEKARLWHKHALGKEMLKQVRDGEGGGKRGRGGGEGFGWGGG